MSDLRKVASRLTCLAVFTCMPLVSIGRSDEPASNPKHARWLADNNLGESCTLEANAYGPDGESTKLSFAWLSAYGNNGYSLQRDLSSWQRGEIRIQLQGTPDVWTARLDTSYLLASMDDILTLIHGIAGGIPIVLTLTPQGGPSRHLTTVMERGPVSAAMFAACVQSLQTRPPPKDFWLNANFSSRENDTDCEMGQAFSVGNSGLALAIDANAARALITVKSVAVMFPEPRNTQQQPSLRPHKTGMEFVKRPFKVDAKDLYGTTLESSDAAQYEITLAQMDTLERELMEGGMRKIKLKVKGEGTRRETFGGPLAAAPAAMFSACRRTKFAAPRQ